MSSLSKSVSNEAGLRISQPEFGAAGIPAAASPEAVTAAVSAAETAKAVNELEMLDAYWASFGDDAARDLVRRTGEVLEVVHGPDDRREVGNPQDYPWRCIASLRITAADGTGWIGTGWLVSRRVLLTAGHCLYMADHGGWASQIEVIPGRRGDNFPYGSCFSSALRSVQGWTRDRNRDYDYGAILLPESNPLGTQLGWFGYQVRDNNNLSNLTVNISGYPGDKPLGTQWFLSGAIKAVHDFEFEYDIDTAGGQSGAPVWVKLDNGNRYGVGIHTNGSLSGNSATRLTQEVYNNIVNWINEAP